MSEQSTRRRFCAGAAGVGMATLAGCFNHAVEGELEWLDAGVRREETESMKTLGGYVVVENVGDKERRARAELRLVREDGAYLTDWEDVEVRDVRPGDTAVLSRSFEISRSSWSSPNDVIEVTEAVDVVFRQYARKMFGDYRSEPMRFVDGELTTV